MKKILTLQKINTLVKHNNIPIFIPELACPHQCVFCNQQKISNTLKIPKPEEISQTIEKHLKTIPKDRNIEIAFFGGSFTGIPINLQERYLKEAAYFVKNNRVSGIRLSTRPDYIDNKILALLKKYHVKSIELGAQSTNNIVLKKAGRGHTFDDIKKASELILASEFELGLQMMIGLPGDSHKISVQTAMDIISLHAQNTRIYPTLVIKGTALAKLYKQGKYKALTIDEAVKLSAKLSLIFESNNIKIIRTGLHPSEEFTPEKSLVAGPYHPSFKELVMTEIWRDTLLSEFKWRKKGNYIVEVNDKQLNFAIGHKAKNRIELQKRGFRVKFVANSAFTKYELYVILNRHQITENGIST